MNEFFPVLNMSSLDLPRHPCQDLLQHLPNGLKREEQIRLCVTILFVMKTLRRSNLVTDFDKKQWFNKHTSPEK